MLGVYAVINNSSGRLYIGSTVNLKRRQGEHEHRLVRGAHENKFLQTDWDHFGKSSFSFEVLEVVDNIDLLNSREQHYMDKYRKRLYNIAPNAGTMAGYALSYQSREKIAKALRGRKSYLRDDNHRRKMSASKTGKKRAAFSQAWTDKISANTRGEKNPNAKLTTTDVIEIRKLIAAGENNTTIAKRFNVSSVMIGKIKRGLAWVA